MSLNDEISLKLLEHKNIIIWLSHHYHSVEVNTVPQNCMYVCNCTVKVEVEHDTTIVFHLYLYVAYQK